MRKSPLAAINLKAKPLLRSTQNVTGIDVMRPKLKHYDGRESTLDFSLLYKKGCQADGKVMTQRQDAIVKLAYHFDKQISDKKSHDNIEQEYVKFKYYLAFCDQNNIDPMTKEGYRSFVGDNGELRRLIGIAKKTLPYLFLYEDGKELGIKEASAIGFVGRIRLMLIVCGVYQSIWHSGIGQFRPEINPTPPYSQTELNLALRRLQYYFFSLSSQLVAHKKANPDALPPDELKAVVDEKGNGNVIEVKVSNLRKNGSKAAKVGTPFNRAMQAAYYLFAYYTSFNSASILDVQHPINILSEKREGRTITYATIQGHKGRSNKDVEGLFSDYQPDSIPEAKHNDGIGYVAAEVDKKDGLEFIRALNELSMLYNNHKNGKLLYQIDESGEQIPLGKRLGEAQLTYELGLLADSRSALKDYLVDLFLRALNENQYVDIVTPNNFALGKTVSKKYWFFRNLKNKKVYLINIAYMAIRCMTDIELKNLVMPLIYSEIDYDGNITVSFNYSNGQHGAFDVASKYQRFFELLEDYSNYYNPSKPSKYLPKNASLKPAYLLPLGQQYQTYQWEGVELVNSTWFRSIGVKMGDYYLSLSSRRFRSTTSNNEYNPLDSGYSVAKHILQNTLNTLHNHYADGHPGQNKLITSQAIQVIEEWAKLREIEHAKSIVKERLNIPVLAYDEWKSIRMATNPNGILCSGKPDLAIQKDYRASKSHAKKLLNTDYGDVSCYQFDLCVTCKSAKLVNDVHAAYKLLSFADLLEDAADRMPERTRQLTEKANYLRLLAEENLSADVLEEAEDKLFNEGRYFLHNDDIINTMGEVEYDQI